MKRILVIDAQGGGIGRQLVTNIKNEIRDLRKAGADYCATGENSVVVACRRADVIIGPIGIVIADSMLGEITPAMAKAVAQADAMRIFIPFSSCANYIAGVDDFSTGHLIEAALRHLKNNLK